MARGMPGRVRSLPKGGGNAARSALRPSSGSGGPGVIRSVAGGAINQTSVGVPQARSGSFRPPGRGSAPAASAAAPGLRGGQPGARKGLQGRTPTQAASFARSTVGKLNNTGLGAPRIASRSGGPATGSLGGRGGGGRGRGTTSGPAGSLTGTTTGTNPAGTY